MLEKQIETKVVKWARAHGWLAIKLQGPGNRSLPDRMFIAPSGTVVFIEFKRPGGKLTELQAKMLDKLSFGHYQYAEMFDNADKAIAYLQDCDEPFVGENR